MVERSKDYHDYVFRDGKLVGEFEEMYRNSDAVPWHQDEQESWIDVRLTVQMLHDLLPFDEIHDLGCGLGYYLALMRQRLGGESCPAFGYDISATACLKASERFPEFSFQTLDMTNHSNVAPSTGAPFDGPHRLFIVRGTLWYVFPKIENVIAVIRALMAASDHLLIVQNFPPLDRPFIGRDVIPSHSALLQHFGRSFVPVRHIWYEDALRAANDNWFIGLFTTRETQ